MIQSKISVHAAKRSDLPVLQSMIEELAQYHGDTATVSSEFLKSCLFGCNTSFEAWIAFKADKPLGYVLLVPCLRLQWGQQGLEMHHLFVDRRCRKLGAGKALVSKALARANETGCNFVKVGTSFNNLAAQQFYVHCGFSPRGTTGPQFSIDLRLAKQMGKQIKDR